MLNKIKEFFGVGGDQKEITFGKVEPDKPWPRYEEEVKDISEPVYTIVEKVKKNPKRLKIVLVPSYTYCYIITDKITKTYATFKLEVKSIPSVNGTGGIHKKEKNLMDSSISLTYHEWEYLVSELEPFLENYFSERKAKIEAYKRKKLTKLWKES